MELVQKYIDIQEPVVFSDFKKDVLKKYHGRLLTGEKAISFGCQLIEISTERENIPIYPSRSAHPVMIMPDANPNTRITMDLFIEPGELENILEEPYPRELYRLEWEDFSVNGYVEQINYSRSPVNNEIKARIIFKINSSIRD